MPYKTSKQLENINFVVKFFSFDGDRCYNVIRRSFYKLYENLLSNHSLLQIIMRLKDEKYLLKGHYLHLTKSQRSNSLKNNISLDESAKVTFSVKNQETFLGKKLIYLKDKSLLSSMRDEYALQMFNMENV